MKIKEFGPGGRVPGAPLDQPMYQIWQMTVSVEKSNIYKLEKSERLEM